MRILQRHIRRYLDELAALRAMVMVDQATGLLYRRKMVQKSYKKDFLLSKKLFHFNGRNIPVSRVVWALVHGEWPPSRVYHRNGLIGDNRPANLTLDVPPPRPRPPSQELGVKCGADGRWRAYTPVQDGRRRLLGSYPTRNQAVTARSEFIETNFL
jgi:hypothetical protein